MPSLNPKALAQAQTLLRKLEQKRNSRIFVYVDVEAEDHICGWQRNWIFSQKNEFKNIDKLEIFLHSGGGHAEFAYQIAKLFRRRCKELNVIVPLMAKSAATLMCLVADNIFMGERSELGSLDVQITDPVEKGMHTFSPVDEFKSMEYLKEYSIAILDYYAFALVERSGMSLKEAFHEAMPAVSSLMAPLYQKIDPSKIGSYRRSLAVGEEYAKRLLNDRKSAHTAKIVENLVWKYPSHDFVIDRSEARDLGLPVINLDEASDDLSFDILMSIFEHGESFYAFTENAPTKAKTKSKARKRLPAPKPTTAPATKTAAA